MADFIENTLTAIQDIRSAPTPGTYIKQRLAERADGLSRAAQVQGAIELANESIAKLTSILYETVENVPVNVDGKTFRILIPVPWGDSGYKYWGVHAIESRIIRAVLMNRQKSDATTALYLYGERRWTLNARTYKNVRRALTHLQENPVTGTEWMRCMNAWHEGENLRNKRRAEKKKTG